MTVYFLIMWSVLAPPFVAGEYQTQERCEEAAHVQKVGLRHLAGGRLHWRCELRTEK
jgi:hypothetical protein